MNTKQIKSKLDKLSVEESLFKKLVPYQGPAETVEGECLRAANRIAYRWFNDGDLFYEGYGQETAGPAYSYLQNQTIIPGLQEYLQNGYVRDSRLDEYDEEKGKYTMWVNGLVKIVEDFIRNKLNSGEELIPNDDDMLNYKVKPSYYDDYYDEDDPYNQ